MSTSVFLTISARRDVLRAHLWYESQEAGLGDRFSAELDTAIGVVSERPTSFPVIHRSMRRAPLSRFPYGVFFKLETNRIVVLGVIDLRRHPRTWKRLARE